MKWAYGVTAVQKRRNDLLPRTLGSLRDAGFDKPRLFVDGVSNADACSWEKQFSLEVTARNPRIRTYGNWVLSLAELYIREPVADRYAIFQDDFVTYRNLRPYLDATCREEKVYWNLYTFPPPRQASPPMVGQTGRSRIGWYLSNQFGKGAVATVFSRAGVQILLTHQHMVERPTDAQRGFKAVDGGISETFRKAGWKEMVHNPSLVQHTGTYSSMGNKPHQQAVTFRGEDFDAITLLEEMKHN